MEGKVKAIEEIDSRCWPPCTNISNPKAISDTCHPGSPHPLTTRAHSNAPRALHHLPQRCRPDSPAENYCEAAAKKNAVVLNEGYMAISRMILAGKPFL